MDRLDGSRTKGLTSSVTAAMRSPKVVLITLCFFLVFSSTQNFNGYLSASRLVDIDTAPFGLVVLREVDRGKLCARWVDVRKTSIHGQNEKRFRFCALRLGGIVTKTGD